MTDQASLLLRKQLKGDMHGWAGGAQEELIACCQPHALKNCGQPTSFSPHPCFAELTRNPVEGFSAGLVDDWWVHGSRVRL